MLGKFHTVMNLLGCIGYLMDKTGLSDILEVIYGGNAVVHGRAYSRAMRGYLIVDQALSHILKETFSNHKNENEYLESLYNDLLNRVTEVETNNMLHELNSNIEKVKQTLVKQSRTAKLWIGYQTIKTFIEADRIAKWGLHLEALQESLVIFAASG